MHWAITLFIGFVVGAISGFTFAAILTVGNDYDRMQETYNFGFEDGKRSVLESEE